MSILKTLELEGMKAIQNSLLGQSIAKVLIHNFDQPDIVGIAILILRYKNNMKKIKSCRRKNRFESLFIFFYIFNSHI